jgi:hypothetical protein
VSLVAFAEREAEAIRNDLESDPRLGLREIYQPDLKRGPRMAGSNEWQVATAFVTTSAKCEHRRTARSRMTDTESPA